MEKRKDETGREISNQTPAIKVRVRLDHDIVDFFKSMDGYNEKINEILRDHMNARRRQVNSEQH
ncbi:MAG: BrnA antitoxin family protein [Acidobacteriota bacterium]